MTFDPDAVKTMLSAPMTDKSIMPFGKHAGKKLEQVPASYLLWFDEQDWSHKYPKLEAYVAKHRELLEDQVQEGDECVSFDADCGDEDPYWGDHD
jgi:hypothetical protein